MEHGASLRVYVPVKHRCALLRLLALQQASHEPYPFLQLNQHHGVRCPFLIAGRRGVNSGPGANTAASTEGDRLLLV